MPSASPRSGPVCVVVPLYNKAAYVRRALESISAQSFAGFEVVVVDDGSTDGGGDIVHAYGDSRVRLVRQDNQGEGAARNRGIGESPGDVIAMLDADDEWDPRFLETIVALRRRYPEAGLLATGYRSRYRGGFTLETSVPGCDDGCLIHDYFAKAARAAVVWSSAQAVPRGVYDRVGLYGRDPVGTDSDMWGRIALRYPIACSSRTLATYHHEIVGYRMLTHFERWMVFPPFVHTARAAVARGEVQERDVPALSRYLNALLLQYVQRVVAARDRRELRRTLREEFDREGGLRRTRAVLRAASATLPLGVLAFGLRARSSRWAWMAGLGGDRELVRRAARTAGSAPPTRRTS
jgi:glycosyltransferase involved in cell wall biosynthesis